MHRFIKSILIHIAMFACLSGQSLALAQTNKSRFEEQEKSVVRIVILDKKSSIKGTGTGFVISPGKIVTNSHVIDGVNVKDIIIIDKDNKKYEVANILLYNPNHNSEDEKDIALLAAPDIDLPLLKMASKLLGNGDRVYAIGYPGLTDQFIKDFSRSGNSSAIFTSATTTEGAVQNFTEHNNVIKMIMHGAKIHPGNSGGPLINDKGEVVDINTSTAISKPNKEVP